MPEDVIGAVDRYPASVRSNVCRSVDEVNVAHQADSVGRIEVGVVPPMELDAVRWTREAIDDHSSAKRHRGIEPHTVPARHGHHIVERHPFDVRRVIRERQQRQNSCRGQRQTRNAACSESPLDRGVHGHDGRAEDENCRR